MPSYVAFLRAINLGARRKFGKDAITAAVEAVGFTGVATHINTGNVRLETAMRSRARIEAALEEAFLADRGFEVPTILFTTAEVRAVAHEGERLAADASYAGRQYVSLLKTEPDPETAAAVEALSTGDERAVVRGRAVHLLLGDGYQASRLDNARVERLLGVATNRNLTVVTAIAARWCA